MEKISLFYRLLGPLCKKINHIGKVYTVYEQRIQASIHSSVRLGDVKIDKNVVIGKCTYMNSGQIFAGAQSKVVIGEHCAIGYNVHIKARSHSTSNATSKDGMSHVQIQSDIVIGDNVWIGDNVFIKHGVTIGSGAIIGANAVVTKSLPPNSIAVGVPAKIISNR